MKAWDRPWTILCYFKFRHVFDGSWRGEGRLLHESGISPARLLALDAGSHALLYALGTTYNLDARTFLYGTIAYVNNSRNGTFSVFATPRNSSSATSPMAGESQTGVYVGMMHTF
jgi:predicted porin